MDVKNFERQIEALMSQIARNYVTCKRDGTFNDDGEMYLSLCIVKHKGEDIYTISFWNDKESDGTEVNVFGMYDLETHKRIGHN